jgi:crossover junction endodeoxyribonuclease RusA
MTVLTVWVPGDPAPQGSKRHVGHGVLIESSHAVKPWRATVHAYVADEIRRRRWTPLDEPAYVMLAFYLRRPTSAPRRRVMPDRKPDLDKLARAVLDALSTAGAVADDARIVDLQCSKYYAQPGGETGCRINLHGDLLT